MNHIIKTVSIIGFLIITNLQVILATGEPSTGGTPTNNTTSNINQAVNFYSPNVESLGRFGQVPISYFNGLPQISVPITTIKTRGFELPLSLSYYAGGNKPDSHPGWTGLGWNLSAGGSIVRIINGKKDEMDKDEQILTYPNESKNPGYYYQSGALDKPDWDSYNSIISYLINTDNSDSEPDEFIVNVNGINASFYLIRDQFGNINTKIKSKDGNNFKVEVETEKRTGLNKKDKIYFFSELKTIGSIDRTDEINYYTYIRKLTITQNDGTIYVFGGNAESIEILYTKIAGNVVGTPNTWHLTKIITPLKDEINFTYKKRGTLIQESFSHSLTSYSGKNWNSGTAFTLSINLYFFTITIPFTTSNSSSTFYYYNTSDPNTYAVGEYAPFVSYNFISPSYLSTINCPATGSTITFSSSDYEEDNDNINKTYFTGKYLDNLVYYYGKNVTNNNILQSNLYQELDKIDINGNKSIHFVYNDEINSRLKLDELDFMDKNSKLIDNYKFSYNQTKLPDYNSFKTDLWGYYNNKLYMGDASTINDGATSDDVYYYRLKQFRTPDPDYMKAEILEKITYPTGGYSEFKFEPHTFSKFVKQFPFMLSDSNSNSIAGGLRVQQIKTYDPVNNQTLTRDFLYENENGKSSGILSGLPIYYTHGNQYNTAEYKNWNNTSFMMTSSQNINVLYTLCSQNPFNQLSNTNGNHVTYSRVIEKLSNGSKTIYNYSNHDEHPDQVPSALFQNFDDNSLSNSFISHENERSLLKSTEYYKNDLLIKKDDFVYNNNTDRYNDYVKSYSIYKTTFPKSGYMLYRLSAIRIYTFFPYLQSKTEYIYDGGQTLEKESDYEYDFTYRMLTKETNKDSKGNLLKTIITYPFHIANSYLPETSNSNTISLLINQTEANSSNPIWNTCVNMNKDYYLNYPVEVTTFNGSNVIASKMVQYSKHSNIYLPDKTYNIETVTPIANFIRNTGMNFGIENADSRYNENPSESYLYNTYNNIEQITSKSGLSKSYLWGYKGQYPIFEIKNATFNEVSSALTGTTPDEISSLECPDMMKVEALRQNSKLSKGQITTYTYKPLVGILTSTNPQGLTTRYLYDNYNRLAAIKDNNYNFVQTYNYAYLNSGTPPVPTATSNTSATITTAGNIIYNVNNTATVTATGGSGIFQYDWTLKNSSGAILVNGNNAGTTFTYTTSTVGTLTLECVVTDLETYKSTKILKTISCDYLPFVVSSINIDGSTDFGMNRNATISATGGSGGYVYSWYLKNALGKELKSNVEITSPQFNFSCAEIGVLTLVCVVKDNLTKNQLTVTYSITCNYAPLYLSVTANDSYGSYAKLRCSAPVCCAGTATASISGGSGNYQITSWKYIKMIDGTIAQETSTGSTNQFIFYNYWSGQMKIQCTILDINSGLNFTAYKIISVI